jgi:hypothetical protein
MQKELDHITSEFTFIQIWFRNCFYTVSSNNHNLEFRDNQKLNALYTNRYFILSLTSEESVINDRDWHRTLETIKEYLASQYG